MLYDAEAAAEFLERFRELGATAREEIARLDREAAEARLLVKQLSTEVDRFGARTAQLRNRVREMELNLNNYDRVEIRDLFDSLVDTQMRQLMMQGQLDQLRLKEQNIANLQEQYHKLTDLLAIAPETLAPEPAPARAAVDTYDGRPTTGPLDPNTVQAPRAQIMQRIIQAQEDERQLVARQIHDGPAQSLTNLILRAEICERLLNIDTNRARTELAGLKAMVTNTLQETRRFIFDLRPMALDDLGLMPTLRKYVQTVSERSKVSVTLSFHGREERMPNYVEVALFRIVQEAVANAIIHGSPSVVRVAFEVANGTLHLEVQDDGAGFDTAAALADAHERKTVGLAGMLERAEAIGAEIDIHSEPGRGTTIALDLPIQAR